VPNRRIMASSREAIFSGLEDLIVLIAKYGSENITIRKSSVLCLCL